MENPFPRITRDPAMLFGKPAIRGMRMSVETILHMLASGMSFEQILSEFDFLEREDLVECLRYASWLAADREVELQSRDAA
jgi:uncharacterized protein (DUF433 family)